MSMEPVKLGNSGIKTSPLGLAAGRRRIVQAVREPDGWARWNDAESHPRHSPRDGAGSQPFRHRGRLRYGAQRRGAGQGAPGCAQTRGGRHQGGFVHDRKSARSTGRIPRPPRTSARRWRPRSSGFKTEYVDVYQSAQRHDCRERIEPLFQELDKLRAEARSAPTAGAPIRKRCRSVRRKNQRNGHPDQGQSLHL